MKDEKDDGGIPGLREALEQAGIPCDDEQATKKRNDLEITLVKSLLRYVKGDDPAEILKDAGREVKEHLEAKREEDREIKQAKRDLENAPREIALGLGDSPIIDATAEEADDDKGDR